jgi:hypothetical protein
MGRYKRGRVVMFSLRVRLCQGFGHVTILVVAVRQVTVTIARNFSRNGFGVHT